MYWIIQECISSIITLVFIFNSFQNISRSAEICAKVTEIHPPNISLTRVSVLSLPVSP